MALEVPGPDTFAWASRWQDETEAQRREAVSRHVRDYLEALDRLNKCRDELAGAYEVAERVWQFIPPEIRPYLTGPEADGSGVGHVVPEG